jgi:tripartite-type tricarboxylate transporter receptor subunit TctC
MASMNRRRFVAALAAAAPAAWTAPVFAQAYPAKPIRVIVPYPPAGGTDVVFRLLSEPLAMELGQPLVIENKGGAAGNLGTDLAAKAPADGYTFLFTLSSHTINPKLYDKLPFDVERDFVSIARAASIPQLIAVHPSVKASSVQELIAFTEG